MRKHFQYKDLLIWLEDSVFSLRTFYDSWYHATLIPMYHLDEIVWQVISEIELPDSEDVGSNHYTITVYFFYDILDYWNLLNNI